MHCGSSGYNRNHLKMAQIREKEKANEKPWLVEDDFGFFEWKCSHPGCYYSIVDMKRQAVASARHNHLRTHETSLDKHKRR